MVVKCPRCDAAYEYDDVFPKDEGGDIVLSKGSKALWVCDDCDTTYILEVKFQTCSDSLELEKAMGNKLCP